MKEFLTNFKKWARNEHVSLAEGLIEGGSWIFFMAVFWFVSRHYHFGFWTTFVLIGIVAGVLSEGYSILSMKIREEHLSLAEGFFMALTWTFGVFFVLFISNHFHFDFMVKTISIVVAPILMAETYANLSTKNFRKNFKTENKIE